MLFRNHCITNYNDELKTKIWGTQGDIILFTYYISVLFTGVLQSKNNQGRRVYSYNGVSPA